MQGDFLPSPPPHSHYFPPSPGADSTGPSPVTLCSAAIAPRGSRASGLPPGASLPGPLAASRAVHVLISPKELGAAELGTYLMQREGAATLQQPAGCHHQGPSTRTYLWDQEPDLSSKIFPRDLPDCHTAVLPSAPSTWTLCCVAPTAVSASEFALELHVLPTLNLHT